MKFSNHRFNSAFNTEKHYIKMLSIIITFSIIMLPALCYSGQSDSENTVVTELNSKLNGGLRNSTGVFKLLKKRMPLSERIAFWANTFIDTPYDVDPLGAYVRSRRIVVDHEVDCMYLVFRSVELALASSPEDAVIWGYKLRFKRGAELDEAGMVKNYNERFRYSRRMIDSGRWGREIAPELAPTIFAPGTEEAGPDLAYVKSSDIAEGLINSKLQPGDLIYFVKDPSKRVVGEMIGHMGIIDVQTGVPMLIHASGSKRSKTRSGGGRVKVVPLTDYFSKTGFIGAAFTRMDLWGK